MIPNPTDEIRAIRNRLAAECDFDLDRIVDERRASGNASQGVHTSRFPAGRHNADRQQMTLRVPTTTA
jgi:hypothetical protein